MESVNPLIKDPLINIDWYMRNTNHLLKSRELHPHSYDCETDCSIELSYMGGAEYVSFIAIEFSRNIDLSTLSDIIIMMGGNIISKISFDILYKISDVTYDNDNVYITLKNNTFPIYNRPLQVFMNFNFVLHTHNNSQKIAYKLHILRAFNELRDHIGHLKNSKDLYIYNTDDDIIQKINYYREKYTDFSNV